INQPHYDRLQQLLEAGTIITGGESDAEQLKIAPTLIEDITWYDPIMQDEIFGPILPIMSFKHIDYVIQKIQQYEKPLALYYFGKNNVHQEDILVHLSFGGGCINDTLYHLAIPHLPFGGVGQSGMGSYHGKASFMTFTHQKSILTRSTAV